MAGPEFEAGPVAVRCIEPLAVLALRHLPGSSEALAATVRAAGLPGLPAAGQVLGQGPWVLWRSPSEVTFLSREQAPADGVRAALAAAQLACAVDQSDGTLALDLQGPRVNELLQRLLDSRSLPVAPGSATRARLADIAVVLVRHRPDCVWLLADRSHAHYLASWLGYAGAALAATPATSPSPP